MTVETYVTKQRIDKYRLWKDKLSILTHLDIELTERCNNNCIHCYINLPADDLNSKEKELSTDQIKEILKEANSLGCLSVRFSGGEPLLRDDFEARFFGLLKENEMAWEIKHWRDRIKRFTGGDTHGNKN